jgi:hypothetical protein
MFQSSCRIHVVREPPIDVDCIPGSNLAAKAELIMNKKIQKGVAFPMSRGLLLPSRSYRAESHSKEYDRQGHFGPPGALELLISLVILR